MVIMFCTRLVFARHLIFFLFELVFICMSISQASAQENCSAEMNSRAVSLLIGAQKNGLLLWSISKFSLLVMMVSLVKVTLMLWCTSSRRDGINSVCLLLLQKNTKVLNAGRYDMSMQLPRMKA